MKIGDAVPVNIGDYVVANATVKEMKDGTATLVVPATLVVMGVKTELADLPSTNVPTVEILGADDGGLVEDADIAQNSPETAIVESTGVVSSTETADNSVPLELPVEVSNNE